MPELRKMNERDAKAQWRYVAAQPADENGVTNPYCGVGWTDYRERVLPELMMHEHPIGMPDWFVPESYYYLWDGGVLVGEVRIRHHLTEALRRGAGHIGYSIAQPFRGRGYGTRALGLALEVARGIVPETEIYLRVRKGNTPSIRAMRRNGAYPAGEDAEHLFFRVKK